jgi:excinuclease ABC subunit A
MADVQLPCETCNGKRFKKELLKLHLLGKIFTILTMTIDDAVAFFWLIEQHKIIKIKTIARCWTRRSLDIYHSSTLSGGEAQKNKTSLFLEQRKKSIICLWQTNHRTAFPWYQETFASFNALIDKGHSIVMEHNLDLIKCADWIIDLGPEGGKWDSY